MTTLREAYDLIDRFLRNNLYDDDYAEYSEALELLSSEPPQQQAAPFSPDSISTAQTTWKMGYEAAKAEMAEQAQPVAWIFTWYEIAKDRHVRRIIDCEERPNIPGYDLIPLYTFPPQREPLTETEVYAISDDFRSTYIHGGTMFDSFDALGFARAIEQSHGIKENT